MVINDITNLGKLKMNRCYKPQGYGEVIDAQLHHFADASQDGYGVVSCVRLKNKDGKVHSQFMTAKARVAPLKPHTIVKLELTAATLAVRQDNMIRRAITMDIDSTVFWTDSQTVLKYIKNERARHPVFVANRIAVIRDGSDVSQWKYVPSKLNPADHASRGLSAEELTSKREWLHGPEFLNQPEENWPEPEENSTNKEESDTEQSRQSTEVYAAQIGELKTATDKLIEHYSDWIKLKKAVVWWLRFKQFLLKRSKKIGQDNLGKQRKAFTVEEMSNAEEAVIKYVQRQAFPKEISELGNIPERDNDRHNHQRTSLSKGNPLASLDPELTDGTLRVGGRLRHALIPQNAKHQGILPKNHHVSTLIIRHIHRTVNHQGQNHVLAELRHKFWIVKARTTIKSIINKCVICRKHQARAGSQKMADLPPSRVKPEEPAFARTGMDYFGPFEVRQGRITRKRYGVIFTCLNSRAVHIEVAESLDTSSCID
jgi:hypothetical protein